jgi:membrane protein implicated in regulation of membrane protease activity
MSWLDIWLQSWELWAIAGLVLALADFLVGGSGNLIALGCASFLMSALAGSARLTGIVLVPSWRIAIVEYAALSAAAVFIVRLLRRPPSDHDLNRY